MTDVPDYATVWAEFEAVRDWSMRLGQSAQERSQSNAAFDAALARLEAHPDFVWLSEIQQDEIEAQNLMLARDAMSRRTAPEPQTEVVWNEDCFDRYAILCRVWNDASWDERSRFLAGSCVLASARSRQQVCWLQTV